MSSDSTPNFSTSKITRRGFLAAATVAPLAADALLSQTLAAPATIVAPATPNLQNADFSFALLGDLHFDRLEHHDMKWLETEMPNDVRQVQNYSRITREETPQLFATLRETIATSRQTPVAQTPAAQTAAPMPFALHIGDFVEGLCGNRELAQRQNREAVEFVTNAKLEAPFLFCKGNHDITGPGAREAFDDTLLPFLQTQRAAVGTIQTGESKAFYAIRHGGCLFAFFDAYDPANSLEWLESTLRDNAASAEAARHVFVLIHPPVVPYGARSLWHIYARPNQTEERARLLEILGRHRAIVLTGHLHKYNLMARRTQNEKGEAGRFVQLAINSVVSKAQVEPSKVLWGREQYTPDQISVEPKFSPKNEAERRAALIAEAPFVEHFEYAELPGYAVIDVRGDHVSAHVFAGSSRQLWKTIDLTALLNGQAPVRAA